MLPVNTRLRRKIILLSPFAIIALGHLTARLAGIALGVWAWIPLTLVLWSAFASLIAWGGGRDAIGRWLRRPHGAWGWSALAMVVGLLPLPIFLLNYQLLTPAWIWLPWLVFASINPWLEEGYWRGLLLDATAEWPGWFGILSASVLFAANHPLTFGVHSIANRHPAVLISTFLMGLVWAIVYRKTLSLRWTIFSHVLVDLFNLSVVVFLNLWVPPEMIPR